MAVTTSPCRYLTLQQALDIHHIIIARTGGLPGVQDTGRLDSVLHHIQNDDYYPTFSHKLTHLLFNAIKLHAFNDGNKRTSLALGVSFLLMNDYAHRVFCFTYEMENVVVRVAENRISKELLHDLLDSLLCHGGYDEGLQLRLIDAIDDEAVWLAE